MSRSDDHANTGGGDNTQQTNRPPPSPLETETRPRNWREWVEARKQARKQLGGPTTIGLPARRLRKYLQQSLAANPNIDAERASELLATVRKRADDWRNGTASVLALITAAL